MFEDDLYQLVGVQVEDDVALVGWQSLCYGLRGGRDAAQVCEDACLDVTHQEEVTQDVGLADDAALYFQPYLQVADTLDAPLFPQGVTGIVPEDEGF